MMRWYARRIVIGIGGCTALTALLLILPDPPGGGPFRGSPAEEDKAPPPIYTNGGSANEPKASKNEKSNFGRRKPLREPSTSNSDGKSEPGRQFSNLPWPQEPHVDRETLLKEFENHDFSKREIDEELVKELYGFVAELDQSVVNECAFNTTLGQYWMDQNGQAYSDRPKSQWDSYEYFYNNLGSCDLYRDEKLIEKLLEDIRTWPVKHVGIMDGGTQVKLLITFKHGHRALWKPMRFGRYYESDVNHFYFSDFERHTAEIGAYHLDKVLGFRRAIPTVGRIFNLSSELRPNAEKALNKTFFWSPAKNLCFVSKCDYYCDTTHAICGKRFMKEGSLQAFLPNDDNVPRKHYRSPYRRTYSKRDQSAIWQKDMTYCDWKVKRKSTYAHGRRLLDLVDMHILDFLMGNQDRHHYESFSVFDETPVYPLHMDNGRGFGRTDFDDLTILYPLMQCCVIRRSTFKRLVDFYAGPISLTQAFHESLQKDQVFPVLPVKHYIALERRLHTIMDQLDECIHRAGDVNNVVLESYDRTRLWLCPTTTKTQKRTTRKKWISRLATRKTLGRTGKTKKLEMGGGGVGRFFF